MEKQLWTIILLSIIVTPLLAQNNTYSVFFNRNGQFASINSLELAQGRKDDKRKLKVKVSISTSDSLLRVYYRPYLEKHIDLLSNIEDSRVELRDYYGLTDTEIDVVKRESECFIANFPDDLKAQFGYGNLQFSKAGCPVTSLFTPYSISVDAFPRQRDAKIVTKASSIPTIGDGWLSYEVDLETAEMSVDKINYKIRFNKPEAQHFNNSLGSFPLMIEYKNTVSDLKASGKIIDSVNKIVTVSSQTADINLFEAELNGYLASLTALDDRISRYFKSYKSIIQKWAWYTSGKPSLNPFYRASDENKIKVLRAEISNLRRDSLNAAISILGSEKKFEFYKETVKTNIKEKLQIVDMSKTILPKSSELVDSISKFNIKRQLFSQKIDSLSRVLKELTEKEKQRVGNESEFRKKDIFWYDGFAFPGDVKLFKGRKRRVSYRNYNRLNRLEQYQRLPNYYDESAEVYILVENEVKGNYFSEYFKDVADEAPLSVSLGDALGQLSSAGLVSAIGSIGNKSMEDDVDGSPVEVILSNIADIARRIEYYDKNILPPPNIPKAFEPDPTFQYRTDYYLARFSDTNRSSYIYNQIVVQDKLRDTLRFRVNKLYHILPSVGLVYSTSKRPEVSLNDDGTIKSVKYFGGSSLMLGLKFHPFATPIYDSKFVINSERKPNFDYRKIHFLGGVNAFRPLKEYYIGMGIDLWSGFSVSGGWHLIYKSQQKLVDHHLDSKKYVDGNNFYFGVNVDVSVAIKLINVLSR